MKLQIQIPDDLYDRYVAKSSAAKAPTLIQQVVARFVDATPVDRFVVLGPDVTQALEGILHGGSIRSEADLLEKVQRLASIEIGHIRLNPSPAQMEELVLRAGKFNRSPEQEIEIQFRQLTRAFFRKEPEALPVL